MNIREMVLSTALLSSRCERTAGTAYLSFHLEAGAAGREVNINIDGTIEVMVDIGLASAEKRPNVFSHSVLYSRHCTTAGCRASTDFSS